MTFVVDERAELRLSRMNHDLSELLDVGELPLTRGGGQSMSDTLWVWGVLGGKEVGKSTLINALAGADVVRPDDPGGEGTFRPACYHVDSDGEKLSARLAGLEGMVIDRVGGAPSTMGGLVLVDLPDFDSVFVDHAEQVRRVASRLDGIIWVTTPKKVGDARAIQEIERVLKSRTNFVYVVNKMDWLLAQSDRSPGEELDRVSSALALQRSVSGANGDVRRSFLISARCRSVEAVKGEISRGRTDVTVGAEEVVGGVEMDRAIDRLLGDFLRLRSVLTTAPSGEDLRANKLANLTYQTRRQARGMLAYYQPGAIVEALDREVSSEQIEQLVLQSFGAGYAGEVGRRLQDRRALVGEWTGALFRRRMGWWPLLGMIAWPAAGLASALSGLRSVWRRGVDGEAVDAFHVEGVSLEERVSRLLTAVETRVVRASDRIRAGLPGVNVVAERFRTEAVVWVDARREGVIGPVLARRPMLVGRLMRGLLPMAVLLWFPLVQPVLEALLGAGESGFVVGLAMVRSMVSALSGVNVLSGLMVSLLIMAGMVGAIYSRAVRDAHLAVDRFEAVEGGDGASVLLGSVARSVVSPVRRVRDELAGIADELGRLAGDAKAGG